MRPLAPFREQVVVVTNLAHRQLESLGDGGGDHSRASAGWLSGVHAKRTEGADVEVGTTADQIAAREIGTATPLASLELALDAADIVGHCDAGYSCAYMNTISWRTPTTPNPMERNPRAVFERLFGDGDSTADRVREMEMDRSLLDSVTAEVGRLNRDLGAQDKRRVDEYLEAIRETERRIRRTEQYNRAQEFPVPDRPIGVPEDFETHAGLMIDLQVLAYQADLTRVITFAFGREASYRTFPAIGISDPHHALSHHQNDDEKLARLGKVNAHHVATFASYLGKLQATPDGDGTLLDHTLLLYGSGMSDGNLHNHSPLPIVLAGGAAGRFKGGPAPARQARDTDDEPAAEHARHGRRAARTPRRQHGAADRSLIPAIRFRVDGAVVQRAGYSLAASAAAAASLCRACQGGPIDRPIADSRGSIPSQPSTVAASRNTRSRSYQHTDQPRASAAVARASRYMTESATLCARLSAMRSAVVGGSSGQTRIAILAIGMGTAAASASRLSRAPRAADSRTRSTSSIASASEISRAHGLFR